MARIGIDATTVTASGKGHSLTQRRSVEALARAGLPYELVALVRGAEAEELLAGTGVRCVRTEHRLMLAWEQVGLPRAVHRHGLDLVLTLTDRLPLWGRGRYVVWLFEIPVHRIEHARASGARLYWRASDLVTRMLWKGSLRRAARVVAGSEATAAEIQAAVPDAPRPIRVVYPGLDPRFRPGPGSEGQRYIFHLASADPRDNTEVALRAFAFALERLDEPVRLLVGGGLGERGPLVAREVARLGLEASVELVGRIPDDELIALYQGASAYVDPTLFEGFGYQVLEAMACGAPVVASNTTSIPELVGDAGLLCDPRSPEQFADALTRVLTDAGLAGRLRRDGPERAARFTWDQTGRALAAVLEEALGA